jgi:hypothetical protein
LRQRTRAQAHALVGWLSGRLDSSVRPCGRARGVAGVGVVYQIPSSHIGKIYDINSGIVKFLAHILCVSLESWVRDR